MKKIFFFIMAILLCACGSTPVPAWKDNAHRHLEDYKVNFLAGKEDASEPHFVKAVREISAGNDLGLLAVAYLTKYALHTASLESFDPVEFTELSRLEANPPDTAYCLFLEGKFAAVDARELPSSYTGVLKAASRMDLTMAAREIAAIDDPLSRLIACGVCVRHLPASEAILQTGMAAASANGWRRPLWAYLAKLHDFYLARGDKAKAAAVEKRLELIKK
jgi:hypothetical protein